VTHNFLWFHLEKDEMRFKIVASAIVVAVFLALEITLITRLVNAAWWVVLGALALGMIAADLVSGLVHWLADTWYSEKTPFIGPLLIYPFREHHRDATGITRHNFFETNVNSCLVTIPVLALTPLSTSLLLIAFIASLSFWVLLTNQIHKWAHQQQAPRVIAMLQKYHIILDPTNHKKHHTIPFHSYYCITTGWLNVPLEKIGFFRRVENMITAFTGATPRSEDRIFYTKT
jgi:plasmanylethanolamine desaturase